MKYKTLSKAKPDGQLDTQTKPGFFSFGIRQKIGLVLITILLLSLGLGGWHSLHQQEELIIEETKLRGSDLARFTSRSVAYAVVGYDYHTIQLLLDELVNSHDINYARVINAKGNVMARAGRLSVESDIWTYFEQEIILNGNAIGSLSIQYDNSRIVEKLSRQRDELIKKEILLILLIAICEYIALSIFIIRPIVSTSQSIKQSITGANLFTKKIVYRAKDELGYLFSHFNTLQHHLHIATKQLESEIKVVNQEVQEQNIRLKNQSNELQKTNEQLKLLSISDPLTDLFNRRHFDILLKKEISFAQRHENSVSLILFDIDHFKKINDQYGHSVGDAVLCAIAKNIQNNTRKSDICCRIGGEEFAIICKETDREQIRLITENLRHKLEQHTIRSNRNEINVTASYGMMTYSYTPEQPLSPDDVYHYADMAMYHSKNNGRNRATYYTDIDATQAAANDT